MEHEAAMRDALSEDSDIELGFQGESPPMPVHSLKLKLASSVLKHLINDVMDDKIVSAAAARRQGDAHGQTSPILKVDGTYEDWVEVIRLMYHSDLSIGPSPSELSCGEAFRIFPIAHQYNMHILLKWCGQVVGKSQLDLWPSAPIAASEVPKHPGPVQWLALADSKQSDSMVDTCLSQLLNRDSDVAIHGALASPLLCKIMDGLRSETKTSIMCKLAGLSLGSQGCIPEIGKLQPSVSFQVGSEDAADVVLQNRDFPPCFKLDLPEQHSDASFSMEGRLFLYPDTDAKSLVVWDADDQQRLGRLEGHTQKVRFVAARGTLAFSSQVGGPPRLWNLETMRCTAMLPDVPGVCSAHCMQDKVLLGYNGAIVVWDVAGGAPVPLPSLDGHTDAVFKLKASASTVLSGSFDKTVRLWDLRTSQCVRVMEGHTETVHSVDMDGHCRTAVSGSGDKTVKLWDLGSGRCTATYEGHTKCWTRDVLMHASGSSFLTLDSDLIIHACAVGSARPTMTADMAAYGLPQSKKGDRLFANRDLSTVALCCTSPTKITLQVWRH